MQSKGGRGKRGIDERGTTDDGYDERSDACVAVSATEARALALVSIDSFVIVISFAGNEFKLYRLWLRSVSVTWPRVK